MEVVVGAPVVVVPCCGVIEVVVHPTTGLPHVVVVVTLPQPPAATGQGFVVVVCPAPGVRVGQPGVAALHAWVVVVAQLATPTHGFDVVVLHRAPGAQAMICEPPVPDSVGVVVGDLGTVPIAEGLDVA